MDKDFSYRMKEQRINKDLTLDELSKITGIGSATLQRYEAGTNEPTIGRVEKIAQALDTPIAYLIGLESNKVDANALDIMFPILNVIGYNYYYFSNDDIYVLAKTCDVKDDFTLSGILKEDTIDKIYIDPFDLFEMQNQILSFADFKVEEYVRNVLIDQHFKDTE